MAETGGESLASGDPYRTDREVSCTSGPVIVSEGYSGDGSWEKWIELFESLVLVNGWDNPMKLFWHRAGLTSRAQTA